MPRRPLSPHLFVYRFAYTMALSILHRISGLALSFSALWLAFGLWNLSQGAERWTGFVNFSARWPVQILLALALLALIYHLGNGIRHLAWDAGWGLEKAQARASGRWLVVSVVIVTALLWATLFLKGRAL
jgi:succinate dehydrogenase / fumarate reductase, cytochrome b subunit